VDQIATLSFIDHDTKDEAVVIVRAGAQEPISALQLAEATASDTSA
jgi:hypothetical protein